MALVSFQVVVIVVLESVRAFFFLGYVNICYTLFSCQFLFWVCNGIVDVFDPFSPTTSLSQVLNLMDQLMEDPFLAASRGVGAGSRRGWDVKEDNDALYIRLEMPGLGKEDVKVSVEENTLTIKGEGEKVSEEEEESKRRYSSRLDLPQKLYKLDSIKAEMKNGVLKVVVPKVKEEEKKEVFHVNIE